MTRENITTLSVKLEMFKEAQDEMKGDIKWLHDKLDRNFSEFANIIKANQKENDEKYASKNIEKWFYSLVWVIVITVVYAVLWSIWLK